MHSDVVSALENGGSIITAGRRLARALHQEFISHQRCAGKTVWKTPDILPVGAYLRQLWSDWISTGEGEKSRLLSPAQEQIVWEQIVRSSPEGESLLNIDATGGAALNAWKLTCAYRLPLSRDFEASEDCSAFLGWARRFQSVCDSNGWLDNSRLADFLANLFRAGKIAPNSRLFLGGFDEITPQLADFLNVACDWEELPPNRYEGKPACVLLRDAAEEIERSAWWARDLLNRDPDAQIGVIVPNLSGLRAGVERTFRRVLHPGVELEDRERAFHLSLGRPLSEYPVIHAAVLMLELAGEGSMALPRLGVLLRSPFGGAAKTEQSERAALDARLRNRGAWNISLETLRKENTDCPHLSRVLRRGLAEVQKTPNQQRPSQWSLSFSRVLKAFGWPGDRTLSSREHQTIEAWGRVLSEFASLDAVLEPVSFSAAVPRLKQLAAATLFQMENEGAPVQIMDILEASSLSFDHLWIMGLHDSELPRPPRPNPFLPVWMQRQYGLPHASAEGESNFARRLLSRLLESAPEVIVSCPRQEGECMLEPSPLIAGDEWITGNEPSHDGWVERIAASSQLETLTDEIGPPLGPEIELRGGARIFRDVAACSFRAFARYRMGARPLDECEPGIGARDRGTLAHRALELIWGELESRDRLLSLVPSELNQLVSRAIAAALGEIYFLGRELERVRLEHLLREWLEIEKGRPPFRVLRPEEERLVSIGGIKITTRIDRIDQLEDGRHVILDYKTGNIVAGAWNGERPGDPQIPLYCITSGKNIGAAAFAQIRTGDLGFRGIDETGSLTDLKRMDLEQRRTLAEHIQDWDRILHALGEKFRSGAAEVDPTEKACDYCGMTSLCRIREIEND